MSYENVAMSDRAFGWDDEIKNDGPDFVLLPEGDYLFTVTAFEREGLLCAFFESIGQRKHGEPLRPRWDELVGAQGMAHVGVREYTKQSGPNAGQTGQANEITRFLPPPEPTAAPQQPWAQGAF